jgi:hypothetical protein
MDRGRREDIGNTIPALHVLHQCSVQPGPLGLCPTRCRLCCAMHEDLLPSRYPSESWSGKTESTVLDTHETRGTTKQHALRGRRLDNERCLRHIVRRRTVQDKTHSTRRTRDKTTLRPLRGVLWQEPSPSHIASETCSGRDDTRHTRRHATTRDDTTTRRALRWRRLDNERCLRHIVRRRTVQDKTHSTQHTGHNDTTHGTQRHYVHCAGEGSDTNVSITFCVG